MDVASREGLCRALAERTQTRPDDWYLVFKARYGMELVFRTLKELLGPGRVATTPFTCCTALDPILSAGLEIAWCDISPATLAISADEVASQGDGDLRAVVMQHSFGIIDERQGDQLARQARSLGAMLVEDSAHCAGRIARSGSGEALADVSIHSFGVEKMIQGSYYGGAVWVNPRMEDVGMRDALRSSLARLPELGGALARKARAYPLAIRVLNHLPAPLSRATRSALVATGLFEPAIADVERRGGLPYGAQGLDERLGSRALAGMRGLDELERRCAVAVSAYNAALDAGRRNVEVPDAVRACAQPLLRYPIVLAGAQMADAAVARACAAGFYTVPWYRPLIFPGPLDAEAYAWDPSDGRCPVARRISAGIVALPCDISERDAARVISLVL